MNNFPSHADIEGALTSLSNSICTQNLDHVRTLKEIGLINVQDVERRDGQVVVFFELTDTGEAYHRAFCQV